MSNLGIIDFVAPPLAVAVARDAAGNSIASLQLDDLSGRIKILFFYQDNCPGCHQSGFPTLQTLVERFRGHVDVSFAAIQTVFEEYDQNTVERGFANQLSYALPIPFGHDGGDGERSKIMAAYRSGGTPWFVVIEDGVVAANGFRINAEALTNYIVESLAAEQAVPEGVLTWAGVLDFANNGNPTPPRRVEKTEQEWAALLTEEQFRVTRAKGTERAHSSDMCRLFTPGRYACLCCQEVLFDAATKYESGTGWPSFTQSVSAEVIGYHADAGHGMQRVEVTCNVCDAHLGHVFRGGPPPGGLRYCINAVSLRELPQTDV